MTSLNRAVPFLVHSAGSESRILLDRFDFPVSAVQPNDPLVNKIEGSLSLTWLGPAVDAETAIELTGEQYLASSEFIYSHPLWQEIRDGSKAAIYAYLLETRHYLAAASSRMSPCVHAGIGLDPLTLLLSKHLLEEYDHAIFFENALASMGCERDSITWCRPLPSTLEWIHLTRAIAARDSLAAALCSGLMEFSSREADAVIGWHSMLVATDLLSSEANAAIFAHVETDLGFGHDKNWEYAIQHAAPISVSRLASALNDVAALTEMIYRWLTSLRVGAASTLVLAMQAQRAPRSTRRAESTAVKAFEGVPVWPASVMQLVNNGAAQLEPSVSAIVATAYGFGGQNGAVESSSEFDEAVSYTCAHLAAPQAISSTVDELYASVCSWLRAIDGHALWSAMTEHPSLSLVQGFMLENYHYLASAARHVSAALSSCPDSLIQLDLIAHMEDELEHCEMLSNVLETTAEIRSASRCRPLPTTIAFVGYLRDLGLSDWKAYLVASAFLQCSLAECRPDSRHKRFYQAVAGYLPEAERLLSPLRQHDDVDEGLGHDDNARKRLRLLLDRHQVTKESLERAAIAPMLAWGFLDGILQHYNQGSASVTLRVGWDA